MKQKVVIRVSMNGQKSRSKALKIAVSVSGVESASLGGQDKSQIEVVGDGVDAVELATMLRKNVGHAELVSVSAVGEKKEEKKEEKKDDPKVQHMVWPYYGGGVPSYGYEVKGCNQYPDPYTCSIM
ncbi:heavy metal-associated isoprenylated plant protein 47 [Ricinus communis]|uniref:Metal ion binding protein, putative n=1 Tax=Ricinus communis TaxID=3988 RepID=B9SF21_RICCO|nr:heavy metal-associated isoprenylated plant protein 47 [Ricinus communis]EEF37798.1 metal ion binding protein, putative [Ricinus communis]|eukprot:XP_002524590.1 heavy metal-associated isoprenylated plant protein 47 [Ricinus communis]